MPIRSRQLRAALCLIVIGLTWCSVAGGQPPTQPPSAADWQARDVRQQQREAAQLAALDEAARARLAVLATEMQAASDRFDAGQTDEALRRFRAAVAAEVPILAGPSTRRIRQLLQLAQWSEMAYDFGGASQNLAQAEQQAAELFAGEHPLALAALNRLGTLHYRTGQYEQAEEKLTQAVELSRRLFGPLDEEHLTCVNNLAALWLAQGRYSRALPALLDTAQRVERQLGREHLQYATALNNLAGVYQAIGDVPRATEQLRQALAIRQQKLGPDHDDTWTALNNLAGLLLQSGQPQEARQLFDQVVRARRQRGAEDPDLATSLSNLAAAHEALRDLAEARRLSREALRIRERSLGPVHPDVATSLNNLALLLAAPDAGEAERLLRRALAIRREQLGRLHPEFAVTLNNLAVHFRDNGRPRDAADWYRQALDAQQQIIEATLPALSERQQLSHLANLRRTLDGYLSVTALAGIEPAEAYRHVLWWKGQVLVRQLARRSAGSEPRAAELLDLLRDVAGQLAAATLAPAAGDGAAQRERRIQELSQQRERLASELAQLASASQEVGVTSPAELAAELPAGAVLIDFLEYWRTAQTGAPPRTELTAFVIQRDKPVVRLEFGAVESLAESIESWLRTYGAPGQGSDAGLRLRERIWLPLAPHVDAARLVLCSPDGCLTRLPLPALPGKQPGTYLIEEQTVVVLPVPQLLKGLLHRRPDSPPRPASLLLVGDIEYGQAPPATEQPAVGRALNFARLPAARAEVLAVRDSFERAYPSLTPPTVLRGGMPTEERFRRESSGHRFIHVVTHGFVAEPSAAASPLLSQRLCGLALAGANERQAPAAADGILTAAEAAELDLRGVDLVALSACETGLGTVAAGEGVLGLQRAFQVAGAQTVIASLWKVDDRATQEMMDLFYERLWSSGNRVSRIEALRESQLTILRGERERGVGLVGRTPAEKRAAPYYWAAFVLSGDWR